MAECVNSCIPTECTDLSNHGSKKKYIPSVTSALIVGSILGLLQAIFLVFSAKFVLSIMGVKSVSAIMLTFSAQPLFASVVSYIIILLFCFCCAIKGSPMQGPAVRYLTIRSLGAPAVLLSLAMQGVFRGFKDTKTPLYATGKNKEQCPSPAVPMKLMNCSFIRQNSM